jgi:hypothetical protein
MQNSITIALTKTCIKTKLMNENQTFGWDLHQHDENSHENDPLNF